MTPDELAALIRRPEPGPHHATVTVDGVSIPTLGDLPPSRDRLLFVAARPNPESVEAGHHQVGPAGRVFWRRLMLAGILPPGTSVETADDALLAAGHGITDLDPVPGPVDGGTAGALTAGVGPLWQKIAIWRPGAVVFIDAAAAAAAAGRPLTTPWGHLEGVALGGRPCFLMPPTDATTEQVDESVNFLRNLAASLPIDRP